jgi:hypothetical protein
VSLALGLAAIYFPELELGTKNYFLILNKNVYWYILEPLNPYS